MHRTQYMCADSCGHDCICQVSPCQCDAALLDGGIGRSQASPGTRNCRHRTQTVPGYPELSLSRQEHTVLAETCTITYHQKWHMLVSYHSGHFHRTFESGVTGEMRSRKHAYPAPAFIACDSREGGPSAHLPGPQRRAPPPPFRECRIPGTPAQSALRCPRYRQHPTPTLWTPVTPTLQLSCSHLTNTLNRSAPYTLHPEFH